MASVQFSFDKSQSLVYGQLIGELQNNNVVLDLPTKKALDAIFASQHDNFSLLSKDIDNIHADWTLKDNVKFFAEKLFKLESFKWEVGGRNFHSSQQTNSIANVYKQFLDHKINFAELQKNVSLLTGIEQTAIAKANTFFEKALAKEIDNKAEQFRIELGGQAFQNSGPTLKMTELYVSYLKGEITLTELFTTIDSSKTYPSVKENSKKIIKSMLSTPEKKELKGYDKLQAFRVAIGGEKFTHSRMTNSLIEVYKSYIDKNIDIQQLHHAIDDAVASETPAAAVAAKAIVFRSDLGGNQYYNSQATIQTAALYESYLKRDINLEQLFYKIDEQGVHYSVKDASKDLIRASLAPNGVNLLKNYDKVQAFRGVIGGGGHLHGPLTNNITNLYKDYVDKKINLKTLYQSMNTLAGGQALQFMEHIFRQDIGGEQFSESPTTRHLAGLFTSYLKGDTELEDLFYAIDNAHTSPKIKENTKDYIREILSYGDSLVLRDYERVADFRKAVGGEAYAYGRMTNKLADLYKQFVDGNIQLDELVTRIKSTPKLDPVPRGLALQFVENLAVVAPTAGVSSQFSQKIQSELSSREADFKQLLAKKNAGEPITLVESKRYLEYIELNYLSLAINPQGYNSSQIKQIEKDRKEVQDYFRETRQAGGYNEIEQAAKRAVLLAAGKNMTATFMSQALNNELKDAIRELANPIITNIDEKKNIHPSITSHQRDIYTADDLEILQYIATAMKSGPGQQTPKNEELYTKATSLLETVETQIQNARASIVDYLRSEQLSSIQFEAILAKPVDQLDARELELVVRGQHAFLEVQKNQGPYLDISMLPQFDFLRQISQLRGDNIDMAKLLWTIDSHNNSPNHPRVAIEGGGPIGLLLGITQFEAGAKVSLYEKRSTLYDRTQIVKLDPKWMNTLQFYLGEEYYKLFTDDKHRGVIRPDGFGEIATLFLEEAIHTRLTHLISMLPAEGDDLPLERMAAYELAEVQKPAVPGGKYAIAAKYQPEKEPVAEQAALNEDIDKALVATIQGGTQKTVTREIDMLICAGGKSSPMKERFLPSSSAVTQDDFYGVCSWLADSIPDQDKEKMDLFQDFRNMAHLTNEFFADYKDQLRSEFDLSNANSVTANAATKKAVMKYIEKAFNKLQATDRTHVQTRTFENRGLIYIGMELPNELRAFLGDLNKDLAANGVPSKEIAAANKQFIKLWFQNIMHFYGLDKTSDLTIDKIDTKFATTFPVDQYRIDPEHLVSEVRNGASELLVTAAGDAFASPHFMRYSGLTGGRENIFHLQDYTKGISHDGSKPELLNTLGAKSERTAKFVISRGAQFLEQLSDAEIDGNRTKAVVASLEKKIKETANNPEFQLEKNPQGEYLLRDFQHSKTYLVIPKPGYIAIEGVNYDSIDQMILQL